MSSPENTFCVTLPGQPRVWDPSRLGPKMKCDRLHYYQTVRGLRRNGSPSVHLEWGHEFHECTRLFDNLLLNSGRDREWCTEAAIDYAFVASWDVERDQPKWGTWLPMVRCTSPEFREHKKRPGVIVANRERCRNARHACPEDAAHFVETRRSGVEYCGDCGEPVERSLEWLPAHPKKTRATLLRAVLLYCDTVGALKPYAFGDGTPGTEIQFRVPLPIDSPDPCRNLAGPEHDILVRHNPDGTVTEEPMVCPICHGSAHEPYELLVNLDSLVTWIEDDEILIRERKTTGRASLTDHYWAGFMMNPQVDSYDLVGNAVFQPGKARPLGLLLETLRIGNKDAEIARLPIHIPEERRAEWLHELCGYIKESEILATAVQRGTEPELAYKRNTTACIGAYSRCQFWDLCTSPQSERAGIIAADFHHEPWDPISCSTQLIEEDE